MKPTTQYGHTTGLRQSAISSAIATALNANVQISAAVDQGAIKASSKLVDVNAAMVGSDRNLGAKPNADTDLATAIIRAESIDDKACANVMALGADPDTNRESPHPVNKVSAGTRLNELNSAAIAWHISHNVDNKRIEQGIILETGTIRPRLHLLDAVNAKAKAWHERWDARLGHYTAMGTLAIGA